LKNAFLDARYEYQLGKNDTAVLNLHGLLRFLDVQSCLTQAGAGTAEQNFSFPIPMIGLNFKQKLGEKFTLLGDFSLANYARSGNEFKTTDYQLGLDWLLGKGWSMSGAYRNLELSGKDPDNNNLRLKYHGPIFEFKYQY